MVQARCVASFFFESSAGLGIGREVVAQELDGDVAVEAQIAGAPHLSHASTSQHVAHLVPAADNKIVFLWFGDQLFEVLQVKGDGLKPEQMLKDILDFQKTSGHLRIRGNHA